MKEIRQCVICLQKFRCKTTANRKTCGGQCRLRYIYSPEFKAMRKANKERIKKLYPIYFENMLQGESFVHFRKRFKI